MQPRHCPFLRCSGGSGGGGSGIGSDHGISWDDPKLSDRSIVLFLEKVFRTYLRTEGQTLL